MSSLEQRLSRIEEKLKQENKEARRRIDLNIDMSPQRSRPRPIIVIQLSPAPVPSQRAALQLPLANDGGGSRSSSSESSPQHHSYPSRPRHMLNLPTPQYGLVKSLENAEIDQKLQEIMKQTGYLKIDGQRYPAEVSDLISEGEIGSGTCGQVFKVRFKKTGHVIAVKQMRRTGNKDENKRILMDLDVVLKSHDCPYIIQCYGAIVTNTDVFIAMELMGTCAEKLKKRIQGPIPERILGKMTVAVSLSISSIISLCYPLCLQIVSALLYLKEKHGVIHRDVKPSNILLDNKGQIKLCDFGISGRLVDSKAKTRSAGCAAYMAPERIDPPDPSKPDYDIRADVWSLGISLVELATGQFPYKNCKTDFEVLTKVLQEDPPSLPLNKTHCEHSFIRRYEVLVVDVAGWFQAVMERTESPRSSQCYSQHQLHSLFSR
uniref:mitogen-activated protein kinase kinase n=1 Tax=Oncorhynchus mykiss TaxID=8022 RepID=A0A8C7V8J0_ONCMY